VRHFIDSLRDEVQIIKRLPKRFNRKYGVVPLEMPPVSWSNEKYYLQQVCVLFTTLYLIGKNYVTYQVHSLQVDLSLIRLLKILLPPGLLRMKLKLELYLACLTCVGYLTNVLDGPKKMLEVCSFLVQGGVMIFVGKAL
jgi:hypothetical protein